MIFLTISLTCYMPCPDITPLFYNGENIWSNVQIMQHVNIQFFPTLVSLPPFYLQIFSPAPYSSILSAYVLPFG